MPGKRAFCLVLSMFSGLFAPCLDFLAESVVECRWLRAGSVPPSVLSQNRMGQND